MALRDRIDRALGCLSQQSLVEALDFAQYLCAKEAGLAWFDESRDWRHAYAESEADLQAGRFKDFASVEDLMSELETRDEDD